MAITYDVTNNVITVTGYSESVPCNYTDLHTADLAGTLQLLAPTSAGIDISLDRSVRPADSGGLKLTIIITNYSPPARDVTLTGTDVFGAPITEDIPINGDGNYESVNYYASIDAGGIDCETGANWTMEFTQPRWGVVSKYSNGDAFFLTAKLKVTGSSTWFADENKQVMFNVELDDSILIESGAHFRLGKLLSAPLKLGENGCHLASNAQFAGNKLINCDYGKMELYASKLVFIGSGAGEQRLDVDNPNSTLKMYGVTMERILFIISTTIAELDLYRIDLGKGDAYAFLANFTTGTLQDLVIHSFFGGFYLFGTSSPTVRNVVFKNNTHVGDLYPYTGTFTMINCDADSWLIDIDDSGIALRKYEFDAHCQDKDGTGLSGVLAVGEYISPYGQAFSVSTDVNGDIATQTVDHGFFDSSQFTEKLKTPLKVTYSKAGYQTVVKYYDLEEKTKDVVVLHKAVGVFISLGTPVINLKKTDPENKNVIVVG